MEPASWHEGQTFLLDVGPVFGTLLVEAGLSVLSFFWFAFKLFTALVKVATLACNNCTVAAKSLSCFLSFLLLWENSELSVSTLEILNETCFFWVILLVSQPLHRQLCSILIKVFHHQCSHPEEN